MQPVRAKAAPSSAKIESNFFSEIVSYNKGFATVATDHAGDILLFHRASNATSWTRTEIYSAADDGVGMFAPSLATSGKAFAIVAVQEGTDSLFSWIGSLAHGFIAQVVSDTTAFSGFMPSVAYSQLGDNYVLTDTDRSGDIDYWYSTTGSGGWQEQTVVSGSAGVSYYQSVVSVTDEGVVIVGSDYETNLDAFYEPFASSHWTMNGNQPIGSGIYLSITWSGSQLYLSLQTSGGVYVQAYSDVGVPANAFYLVYSTPSGYPADYIAWSGSNAVVVSLDDSGNLDFFYSNSNVTAFSQETVVTDTSTLSYGVLPTVVVGHNSVVITDSTNKGKLYAWLQHVGGTGWTQQLIGA